MKKLIMSLLVLLTVLVSVSLSQAQTISIGSFDGSRSPPPLALLYDFAQIRNRPYLIRSQLHAWMLRDKLNGKIEVSRLKDEKACELFLGFRIGAVGRRDFAVFPVQGQRGLRRLKRYFGNKMPAGAQMIIVLKAFVEHCVSPVLCHPFEFSWLEVSQTDVFHCPSPRSSSLGRSQQHCLRARCPSSSRVVELSGLQRPGDLVSIEDDAGRKCIRADELE